MKKLNKIICLILVFILILPMVMNVNAATSITVMPDAMNTSGPIQDAINNANVGDIVNIPNGEYSGNIIIDKAITLKGDTSTIIKGTVNYKSGAIIENLTIEGVVAGENGVKITNCILKGGISILDEGLNEPVEIKQNTIYYNENSTHIGLKIEGLENNNHRSAMYTISSNTFVNQQGSTASVMSWPFETYLDSGNQKVDQLDASQNYWKNKTEDANFNDIKVSGNVKYYVLSLNTYYYPGTKFMDLLFVPNEGMKWVKAPDNNNADYFEAGDYFVSLFNRKINDIGLPIPDIRTAYINKQFKDGQFETVPNKAEIKFETMKTYRDVSMIGSYDWESEPINERNYLYLRFFDPYMKFYVEPRNLVAYSGGTSIENGYPLATYDFYAPNIYYDKNDPTSGEEFIYFNQRLNNGGSMLSAYLKDEGKYYNTWDVTATGVETDPLLDKDGDLMPFVTDYVKKSESAASSVFKIDVGNQDNVTKFKVDNNYNLDNWVFPQINMNITMNLMGFYPEYKESNLTLRKISNDTSITKVEHNTPSNLKQPTATIENTATYIDSANKAIAADNVSLFNDNQEPDTIAYNTMLNKTKALAGLDNAKYAYHHLSLVNHTDGNNLVTTTTPFELFLPYPKDYDNSKPLEVVWFKDYHRMPTDNVNGLTPEVIKNITYGENGITLTMNQSDIGSLIIAYNIDETVVEEPTQPNKPIDPTKPTPPIDTSKPSIPSDDVVDNSPKTNDYSMIGTWGTMITMSGCIAFISYLRKKEVSKNKQ